MKIKFKNLEIPLLINLIFIIISIFLGISNSTFNFMLIFKILLISSLNLIVLLRVKDSYFLLYKIKKLENLNFHISKDITIILFGGILFLVTYSFLFLDSLGFINIFKPIGEINIKYKLYVFIILLILMAFAFFSNISGIIVRPYFKNGIIIGYYIFYFKDIKEKYKDNAGNIVITGFNEVPFKIVISAKRSKSYFSYILNIN